MFARLSSALALQAQAVIVGWQIYQIRHDPLLLGLIGLAEAVPAISGSFISGHMVDTHRPAVVFRWSLTVLFLNSCALWLAVAPFLSLGDELRLTLLFCAVFVSGAARSFSSPAVFSIIPRIVSRKELAAAAALNSSTYQIASIAGPAIGGLVFGAAGAMTAFAIPALAQLAALISAFGLSHDIKLLKNQNIREPFVKSVRSGLKFTFTHRVILSALTLDMFSVLFGGAVAVLPIYADQVLHVGSMGLGFLRAAPSIGSVCVALVIAFRPMRVISGATLLWVVAGFGLSTLAFAVSTSFVFSMLCLAASGAFDGVSMVIRSTILQLLTPENMRGRVSSVSSVFITSSNEIGAFESGAAARLMGLVPSVVFGGLMTLVVVAATALLSPELRKTRIKHDE